MGVITERWRPEPFTCSMSFWKWSGIPAHRFEDARLRVGPVQCAAHATLHLCVFAILPCGAASSAPQPSFLRGRWQ